MKRKILIAGAGQLGSRYLQGLSKVSEPLEIWVFDPSSEALARSEQRWNEMQHDDIAHEVKYATELSALPTIADLAIVATTATVRMSLVQELNNHADIRYWVLEKVLSQCAEDLVELQKLLNNEKSVWVNTPMHLWELYRNIRAIYPLGPPIDANFVGFRGLACNTIHYVDFVGRWNRVPVTEVDASGLHTEWYPSKRDGFYEVDGEIKIYFADGSKLRVSSDRNNLGYKAGLLVAQDEWQVSEDEGIAYCADGRLLSGTIGYQSQMTAPLVETIFAGLPCGLPTLAESAQQHTLILNALLKHWNQHMPDKLERLPIT